MTQPITLILASASQRRQQFLRDLGLTYTIHVADIDETPLPAGSPGSDDAAPGRSQSAHRRRPLAAPPADALIIASDTTVALGDEIYGKPLDAADAVRMLRDLRARDHIVISAVSVLRCSDRRLADARQRHHRDDARLHRRRDRRVRSLRRPAGQGRRLRHPVARLCAGQCARRLLRQRDGAAAGRPVRAVWRTSACSRATTRRRSACRSTPSPAVRRGKRTTPTSSFEGLIEPVCQ
jgi:predicted house-cleaning NTP pyrophosphatase (Maf/HAM1 superfamily)